MLDSNSFLLFSSFGEFFEWPSNKRRLAIRTASFAQLPTAGAKAREAPQLAAASRPPPPQPPRAPEPEAAGLAHRLQHRLQPAARLHRHNPRQRDPARLQNPPPGHGRRQDRVAEDAQRRDSHPERQSRDPGGKNQCRVQPEPGAVVSKIHLLYYYVVFV